MLYPKNDNFYFPAEWHHHEATWLSFPINIDTWEDRFEAIYPAYFNLISKITESEKVRINLDLNRYGQHFNLLKTKFIENDSNIEVFDIPTNDSWCRDHGPAFLINKNDNRKVIVDWEYNAWGGKYPPFDFDNNVPKKIANQLGLNVFNPGIVMEGGSVEFNGNGTVLTSRSCLLNKNRNPNLSQPEIEQYLMNYYGVEQVLWVEDGIVGDDTDGHIDDTTRFINENTVITMVENNNSDPNHHILNENLDLLKQMKLLNGEKLNIIPIQMPDPVVSEGVRLPASYANFIFTNKYIIVPIFNCKNDDLALRTIQDSVKDREVIGIDSTEIIWGLGSFHCLSQQEPVSNF